MGTYVYDFAEGDKDQKDLLGGKGANLAEMTNLGLPVPPGFTISTAACRAYLEAGDTPDGLTEEVSAHLDDARGGDGTSARRRRGPPAGERAERREVLDARDDGDGPQHRPQRRVDPGPRQAERRRAVRDGLLPPAAADVRRHRPGHRRRALLRGPRRPEAGQGTPTRTSTSTWTTSAGWWPPSSRSSATTPAGSSPRTRASRWTSPSRRSSTPGTPTARSSTAVRSGSPRTSAPRSTSRRWCSATAA